MCENRDADPGTSSREKLPWSRPGITVEKVQDVTALTVSGVGPDGGSCNS